MALVRRLGRISYSLALDLQLQLIAKYKDSNRGEVGELLLLEHYPPVYTFGLRQKDYATEAERLEKLGAQVYKVRRGGLTTFHGLGQLVCYPILNMRLLKLGVREYVCCLEKAVIATCNDFGVPAHTTEHTGVWVGDQKICALGIQVSRGVTFHGLALNCDPDLSWFDHITPCGVEDRGVTSLSQQLGRTVSTDAVIPSLVQNLTQSLSISYY